MCQRPDHSALSVVLSTCIWSILNVLGSEQCSSQATSCDFFKFILSFSMCFPIYLDPRCTMRIGKGIHPDGVPGWCQGFSLDGGSGVRAVKVIQHGNRPGLIYNIGKLFYFNVVQYRGSRSGLNPAYWTQGHEKKHH